MTKYVAWRIFPDGTRRSIRPGGRRVFGPASLAYVKRRAKRKGHKIRVQAVRGPRDRMRAAMKWGLSNEPSIHYLQRRPFDPKVFKRRKLPIYDDCSATTTQLFYAAGLPDPNRRKYDGSGYTGTLRARGHKIPLHKARRGDYIVYGTGTGRHVVVVYRGDATNPIVWSHGQESGPRLYSHAAQVAAHGNYFTVHSAIGA